jgi:ribosomal protein S18 acetylase RimI-like enzyme
MAEFRFTNEHSSSETGNIVEVLERPRLWIPTQHDYPDFSSWVLKTEARIAEGSTRAMIAYLGTTPAGVVIYQQHETKPETVKVRNISVSPDAQGRYIGSFLLRNTEIEAMKYDFPGCKQIMVDTKQANTRMISFLIGQGYSISEVSDLYGLEAGLDTVMVKTTPDGLSPPAGC